MKKDIILIGPVGAGKSTIGKLQSDYLEMPQASLDDERSTHHIPSPGKKFRQDGIALGSGLETS